MLNAHAITAHTLVTTAAQDASTESLCESVE